MLGQIKHKTNKIIAIEWDKIAHFRSAQLKNHEDISMDNVLIPYVLEMITSVQNKSFWTARLSSVSLRDI
jgi:hypothetical protein